MTKLGGHIRPDEPTAEHLLADQEAMELMDDNMLYNKALDDLLNAAIGDATIRRSTHIRVARLGELVHTLKSAKEMLP